MRKFKITISGRLFYVAYFMFAMSYNLHFHFFKVVQDMIKNCERKNWKQKS